MILDVRVSSSGDELFCEFVGQAAAIELQVVDGIVSRKYVRVPEITNALAPVHIRLNNGSGIGNIYVMKIGFIGLTGIMFPDGD